MGTPAEAWVVRIPAGAAVEGEHRSRPTTGLDQLLVELMHQKTLQRKLCRDADARTHDREQCQLGHQ